MSFNELFSRRSGMVLILSVSSFLVYSYLYFPGIMDWDSASIDKMAKSGLYSNWFSPSFIYLWHLTSNLGNPGAIWLIQIFLLLFGVFLFSCFLLKLDRYLWSVMLGVAVLSPPFVYLFHEVIKDTFMVAALVALSGISSWLLLIPAKRSALLVIILVTATLALLPRYNAVFAVFPILSLAFYALADKRVARGVVYAFVATVTVLVANSAFVRFVLHPDSTSPLPALITYDIAGIAHNGGESPFVLERRGNMEEALRCYTPVSVAPYFKKPCGNLFGRVMSAYEAAPLETVANWLAAIIRNPISYTRHRFASFKFLLRFPCRKGGMKERGASYWCKETGMRVRDGQNPTPIRETRVSAAYEKIGHAFFMIMKPWIATVVVLLVFFCAAWAWWRVGESPLLVVTFALTSSALIYLLPYMVIGMASVMRYLYWSYVVSFIAPILFGAWFTGWRKNLKREATPRARLLVSARAISVDHE
jgi:hypothetical protein